MYRAFFHVLFVCCLVFLIPTYHVHAFISMVSVDENGVPGSEMSVHSSVTPDGRFVVFSSFAENMTVEGNSDRGNVFVYDRQTGVREMVSVSSSGVEGNSNVEFPTLQNDISADGRFVVFMSNSTNLVDDVLGGDEFCVGDAMCISRIYLHDRQTGQTILVSPPNNSAQDPAISADGQFVVFMSGGQVFVYEVGTQDTTLISTVHGGGDPANNSSYNPSISADGRFVSFPSNATNLVLGGSSSGQVFLHDRQTGETILVSVSSDGVEANGYSYSARKAISGNGRYVVFESQATNLVPGGTSDDGHVFVHDSQTGETSLVSVGSDGGQGDSYSTEASISADGTFVAFTSGSSNLVEGFNIPLFDQIYLRNLVTEKTYIISLRPDGNFSDGFSSYLPISIASTPDGPVAVFTFSTENLITAELDDKDQVYIVNLFVNDSSIVAPEETATTITGEWDEENAIFLRVSLDDVEYELGVDDELATDGEGNWTLTLPEPLEGNREYTLEVFTQNPFAEKTTQSVFTILIPITQSSSSSSAVSGSAVILCTEQITSFCSPVSIQTQTQPQEEVQTPQVGTPTPINNTGVCQARIIAPTPIRLGGNNNPDMVREIQNFLNQYEQANIEVTGIYDTQTEQAVRAFQSKYALEILAPWGITQATGIVYTTTSAKMNAIMCGETLGCPVFTQLTRPGESNSDVPRIKNFLNVLLGKNLDINSNTLDTQSVNAVKEFQTRYKDFVLQPWNLSQATGWWYQTTSRQANKFMGCELDPITLSNGVVVE